MEGHEADPPISASPSETNLADLLTRQVERRPDRVALVEPAPERRSLTWSELDRQVSAVGAGLAAHGLVAGHRVALMAPNSVEFVVAYFAVLRAGFVAVPINPQLTDTELRAVLQDSGARVLIASHDPGLPGVHWVPCTPDGLRELADVRPTPVSSPQDAETLAALLYTAGTSGEPKAVMLTHRALLAHLRHLEALDVVGPDTVVAAVLPLFHVFGLNAVLGSWVGSGGRLVIMDGFDGFFDVLAAEQVTNLPLAPVLLDKIITDERSAGGLGSLSTVISGAAPLPEDLRTAFTERTGLRVEQGYGLTEAAPGVSATLGGPLLGPGHVGRPLPGVEIRIGDGSDLTEPGEIAIRGDNLFSGYWPDGRDGPDPEGWFRTGDIGYLLDGELFLVDRSRELIIVNGFNVYPAEVEQAVAELDGVESVAVLGHPDPATGERVVAFVTGIGLTVEAVEAHCAGRLAKFKRPSMITLVDELPRGATGKVQKGQLRLALGPDQSATESQD